MKNFFSKIKYTYLGSEYFNFHRRSCFQIRKFREGKRLIDVFSKTGCQSPRPTVHNFEYFWKLSSVNKNIYVFRIGRFEFSLQKLFTNSKVKTARQRFFFSKTCSQSPRPTVDNFEYFRNFFSLIKYMYLGSGDFNFHRRQSFPISKISQVNSGKWRYFRKHGVSLHVLLSTILNIFEKLLQYNEVYLRSGNLIFHRRESFPNLKISNVTTANWWYFQKHGVSFHVLPSTF